MRKSRYAAALIIAVLCMATLAACSAKNDESAAYDYAYKTSSIEAGYGYDTKDSDNGCSSAPQYTGNSVALASTVRNTMTDMEKIIRNISMNIETKEFDKLVGIIEDEIANLEGYVEISNITGRRYSNNDSLRRGNIIARIPKDKADLFIDTIYDNANVINKSESIKNISLEYYDIESHKKALEIEQERLFELLEKTDTVEEIISLESRLSSIRYELSQYETQLRTYDNKVDYSTIALEIEEVERMSPAAEEKVTVWKRISTGFSNTMYRLGKGFQNFFIWFVINLPYLLILGAVTTAAIIVTHRYIVKMNRKKNNKNVSGKLDASNKFDESDK